MIYKRFPSTSGNLAVYLESNCRSAFGLDLLCPLLCPPYRELLMGNSGSAIMELAVSWALHEPRRALRWSQP